MIPKYTRLVFVDEIAIVAAAIESIRFERAAIGDKFKVIIRTNANVDYIGYSGSSERDAYSYRNGLIDELGLSAIAVTNEGKAELGL